MCNQLARNETTTAFTSLTTHTICFLGKMVSSRRVDANSHLVRAAAQRARLRTIRRRAARLSAKHGVAIASRADRSGRAGRRADRGRQRSTGHAAIDVLRGACTTAGRRAEIVHVRVPLGQFRRRIVIHLEIDVRAVLVIARRGERQQPQQRIGTKHVHKIAPRATVLILDIGNVRAVQNERVVRLELLASLDGGGALLQSRCEWKEQGDGYEQREQKRGR